MSKFYFKNYVISRNSHNNWDKNTLKNMYIMSFIIILLGKMLLFVNVEIEIEWNFT